MPFSLVVIAVFCAIIEWAARLYTCLFCMEPSCQGLDSAEKSDSQGGGSENFQGKISEYPLLSDSFDGLQRITFLFHFGTIT